MPDDLDELTFRYSRRAYLGFGIGFLILAYGGIGMVLALIPAEAGQRSQQIAIGLAFLAVAALVGVLFVKLILAAGKPVLTLDGNGLWDRRLTTAPIPWSAIAQIERIDPSFFERMILLGSSSGKILVRIRENEWDRIPFIHNYQKSLHAMLLAGEHGLRIFHKALDSRYPLLSAAVLGRWQAEKDRRGPD
jgi:hypothetical protein